MATVTILRRATGKAHTTSVLEGDQAILGGLVRSTSGAGALYDDANTTSVTLGAGSAVTSVTLGGAATTTGTLLTGAAMTTLNIGTGMGAGDNITIGGASSTTTVAGDLVVNGTTTSVDSEVVNIADNHLYLNKDYTTASAQTGGLVVNYLPTATADTSDTGGFATTTTVVTTGSATFTAGDFIQVSGAANAANDGLYEVLSHVGTTLTIDAAPTHSFVQTAFTVDTGDTTAAITNVTVSALQAGTDGVWETGNGADSASLTFSDLATATGTTLNQAYINGNTITTSAGEGDVIVAGTESLQITATNGLDVDTIADFDVTTFDVQMTGSNGFSIDGTAASNVTATAGALTLSTVTSGDVAINSAAGVDIDSTTTVDILATTTFSIDGTGASNVTATSGNLTLSTATSGNVIANAAGAIDIDAGSSVDILATTTFSIDGTGASNVTADTGTLTLSTTTSGDVTIDAVDSVTVDGGEAVADAVRIVASNAAGGIDIDAGTAGIDILTTGAFSIDGTGASNVTATSGNLTLSTATSGDVIANAAGAVDIDAGSSVDILATTTFSIDGTGASNVTATSGNLTLSTVTSGNLIASSAGNVDVDAGSAGSVTIDAGTGGLSLDSTGTTNNLTVTANDAGDATLAISATNAGAGDGDITITADQDIIFDGNGMTTALPFNGVTSGDTGNQDLSSNFTATTLVGALNELKEGGAEGASLSEIYTTTARTIGEAVIIDGNSSAATQADASALATAEGFVGLVKLVGGAGVGEVYTSGTATALFEDGTTTPAAGDPIYLSEVAGRVTGVAPTGTPNSGIVVFQIGILKDATGLTGGTIGTDESAAVHIQPMQLFEL